MYFFSLLQGDKNIVCLASSPSRLIVFYDKTYYENYKSPIQLCSRQLVNRGTWSIFYLFFWLNFYTIELDRIIFPHKKIRILSFDLFNLYSDRSIITNGDSRLVENWNTFLIIRVPNFMTKTRTFWHTKSYWCLYCMYLNNKNDYNVH